MKTLEQQAIDSRKLGNPNLSDFKGIGLVTTQIWPQTH